MSSIELPFEVGVQLWRCSADARQVTTQCPDCIGTRTVKLVLPCGETLKMECGACSLGYNGAQGQITDWVYSCAPVPFFTHTFVRYDDGEAFYRDHSNACVGSKSLFRTREECESECARLNLESEARRIEQEFNLRKYKRKDKVSMAQFARREIRKLEAELERRQAQLGQIERSAP